jgi:CBS domain containing-hemolysin-like protein
MTLLIVYILIALFFSFYCSVAEAVLLSVTQPYIIALKREGRRTAGVLQKLKEDVNRPLAAILTLNTIAHTVGAAGAGAQAAEVFGSSYVGAASAVLTLLILFFSEIIPKTLGANFWRTLAPFVGLSIRYLVIVLYPLVVVSEFLTKWLSREGAQHAFKHEEVRAMADIGEKEGVLGIQESRVLRNLLGLSSTSIQEVMTPRTVVFALPEDTTVGAFFADHARSPFSRIPVFVEGRDRITGFALKDDLLLAHARDQFERKLDEFRRDIRAVPQTNSVSQVFEILLNCRGQIALVVDEYGGTAGIVTLEDVLETLLGMEIVDESDTTVDMQAKAREMWKRRASKMGLAVEKNEKEEPPPAGEAEEKEGA